jgi:hypothetical protein
MPTTDELAGMKNSATLRMKEAVARGIPQWEIVTALTGILRLRLGRYRGERWFDQACAVLKQVELLRDGKIEQADDAARWTTLGLLSDSKDSEIADTPAHLLEAALSLAWYDSPLDAVEAIECAVCSMIDDEMEDVLWRNVDRSVAIARARELVASFSSALEGLTKRRAAPQAKKKAA